MDAPDWTRLERLVDEYGHGCIKFVVTDPDGEQVELAVEDVTLDGDDILVVLNP